jgi:diguanylate cyclase (GGDEF)-like protein
VQIAPVFGAWFSGLERSSDKSPGWDLSGPANLFLKVGALRTDMSAVPVERRRCYAFLGAGLAATACYYLLPGAVPLAVVYLAVGGGSATAIALRARPRGTATGRGWALVATGIGLFCVGDLIWYGYDLVLHRAVPAASAADVFYLAGFPFLASGVLLLVRARTSGQGRDGWLDGLTLASGMAVLVWKFVLHPTVADTTVPVLDRVVAGAYPVMDVVIFVALARLLLTESRALPTYRFLLAGLLLQLGGDLAFALVPSLGTSAGAQPLDWTWMSSYVLLACAALHPSMRRLAEPVTRPVASLGWVLTLLLAGSLAAAPVVLTVARPAGALDRVVLLALFATGVVLVVARLRGLIAEKDEDLAARSRIQDELAHSADHDALTGLPNRRLFMARLERALDPARSGPGHVAVLFVDLDRFKLINDTAGHHLGDQVLIQVARRLADALRPADTVARFGGDEFTVLCQQVADTAGATAIADRLAAAVAMPVALGDTEIMLAASIGICMTEPGRDRDAATLLRDADAAMYQAKARGRDRYEIFDETLRATALARLETEGSLRRAIDGDELCLHYQPEIVLESGALFGVEALMRWQHPTRGLVAPGDFIPIAEETGLIVAMGEWALRTACAQAVAWPEGDVPRVAVNLSARQLAQPELASVVADVLAETGLPGRRLMVEVTESTLLVDGELARETLLDLKRLGVTVALDDFGTGYSSLSFLRRFPVDIVKIDGSFVAGLGRDQEDTAIVRAIVSMAASLGLLAVAEGVERPEQAEALRVLGCDVAQGFHFARPAPADQLVGALQA